MSIDDVSIDDVFGPSTPAMEDLNDLPDNVEATEDELQEALQQEAGLLAGETTSMGEVHDHGAWATRGWMWADITSLCRKKTVPSNPDLKGKLCMKGTPWVNFMRRFMGSNYSNKP